MLNVPRRVRVVNCYRIPEPESDLPSVAITPPVLEANRHDRYLHPFTRREFHQPQVPLLERQELALIALWRVGRVDIRVPLGENEQDASFPEEIEAVVCRLPERDRGIPRRDARVRTRPGDDRPAGRAAGEPHHPRSE